jgi:hypothetical protein
MFHILGLVFFLALLLMPWVSKVSAGDEASPGH